MHMFMHYITSIFIQTQDQFRNVRIAPLRNHLDIVRSKERVKISVQINAVSLQERMYC